MTRFCRLLALTAIFSALPAGLHAAEIELSPEKRQRAAEEAGRLEGRFSSGVEAAAIGGASADRDKEVIISGTLVAMGDQVLQIRNESLKIDYFVNYSRTLELAAPAGQRVEVHGMIEQIDVPARRITVRGLQVDAPKGGAHHH